MKMLASQARSTTQQFLIFLLEGQEYGLELLTIQEIQGYTPTTPIPNVRPYICGVMNLRGAVLPVIDLRIRFGLPPAVYDKFTVIVIAMVNEKMIGLLVDAVSDVLAVSEDSLREAPDFGAAVNTRFIKGVFEARERLAVALDLEKLLEDNDFAALEPAS